MSKPNNKNILIMAAGTGGHIFPALAVAQALHAQGANIFWLGTPDGMEQRIVKAAGFPIYAVQMGGVRGKGLKRLLATPLKLATATRRVIQLVKTLKIDVVAGFGGYITVPGGLAATLTHTPLLLQEQNAIAGLSNRVLARLAQRVCLGFPTALGPTKAMDKISVTGNPIRDQFGQYPEPASRYTGRNGPLTVQIVGGSLGAQALNETVPLALDRLNMPLIVHHQCGADHVDRTRAVYDQLEAPQLQYEVMPFIDDVAKAYAEADLVLCRAGASTISELAAIGAPAVLIPYPHAVDDHQTQNALYLAEAKGAVIEQQAQLTPDRLADLLRPLLDRQVLEQMAQNAYRMGRRNATREVAQNIVALVQ